MKHYICSVNDKQKDMTIDYTITRHGRNATITVTAEGETLGSYAIPTKAVRPVVDKLLRAADMYETPNELKDEMDLITNYL